MSDRTRPPVADEIETTKEMLDAGLAEFPSTDSFYHDPPQEIVSWIFRAMFAAWRDSDRGTEQSA
jgi:hypothetical protein